MQTIAVLGTGTMGAPMARNLLRAGFGVRVWNRSRDKAEPLAADGATVCATPAEAVDGADLLMTVLSDADAVLAVAREALPAAAGRGAVWIQSSTIGLEGCEGAMALARERGVPLVDAPVLGTKQPAEQGKLVVLAGAAEDLRERVQPVFDAVAARTLWVGEAGAGTRLKLVVNTWLLSLMEGLAEALALAERLDLEPRHFLDAIEGGPIDAGYARVKGKAIAERAFDPAFSLALAAKDARLIEEAARRIGLDLPLVEVIARRFAEGVERGHGDLDMAATFLTSAAD
jgi:3-hydroxyisobutyrate dehydrogenase